MRIAITALALRSRPSELASGIARYCYRLIEGLLAVDADHEYVVVVSPGFEVPERWQAASNFRIVESSGPVASYKTLWDTFAAAGRARGERPDVWFSTAHGVPIVCPCPKAVMVHDLFTFSHPETYTLKHRLVVGSALVLAIRTADRLLVPSEHTRHDLGRRFGVSPKRVSVTPLAPATDATPRSRDSVSDDELDRLGLAPGPFLFTLSTVEPRKNLSGLLLGLRRLLDADPHCELRLVVGGARGWKSQSIERRVRELGLEARVTFLGFVPDEDLPVLFARCEGFVLASLAEGFGMPVLEAMHFGAPVACSATGALPEVGGDAALYFDPLDPDDIARTLALLLDAETRARRVEAGRRRAAAFSWERTARLTLAALEELA